MQGVVVLDPSRPLATDQMSLLVCATHTRVRARAHAHARARARAQVRTNELERFDPILDEEPGGVLPDVCTLRVAAKVHSHLGPFPWSLSQSVAFSL